MSDDQRGRDRGREERGPTANLPVDALQRFLDEGMPGAAMAHSFHVDALMDPRIGSDPVFQAFSLIELNELHHMVSTMGALLRLKQGDPTALASLGTNLAGFLQNRQAAGALVPRFPPYVARNPAVRRMMALIQQSNKQLAAHSAVIQQTLKAADGRAPGPLLVNP